MNDEQGATTREMGGRNEATIDAPVGHTHRGADGGDNPTAGRVRRAMAQAQGAADQAGGIVRARLPAAAAIALGAGDLVGWRR